MSTTITRAPGSWWILAAALLGGATGAEAQMAHPTPVPADDPRAQRAGQMVERILTGDMAQVQSYLAEHGAEGYAGTPRVAEQAEPLMALLEGRALEVEGYLAGPERSVIVVLMDPAGRWSLIQVALEAAAPFRITKLAEAELRMR